MSEGGESAIQIRNAIDCGDTARAASLLVQVLRENQNNAEAFWQAGRLYGHEKQYKKASAAFLQALRLDRSLSQVEFCMGSEIIKLYDSPGSAAAAMRVDELGCDMYGLQTMKFVPGDVVVDIGAHIGSVSVVLGKLYPDIKIIAYEPAARTFEMLVKNLKENGVTNVTPVQQAVSGQRGTLDFLWSAVDTAGSGSCMNEDQKAYLLTRGWKREQVQSVALRDVFDAHFIDRCAWLKLDCEGSEYDIVKESDVFNRVDKVALELHLPASRASEGEDALKKEYLSLFDCCSKRPEVKIVSTVFMMGK